MNKTEMADRLAARTGLGKGAARDALDGLFAIIGEALADGEDVRLPGFGTFGTRSRPARTGRNPRTGEAVSISASTLPTFKAGEDAEGQREWRSGIVTVRREKTATGSTCPLVRLLSSIRDVFAMALSPRCVARGRVANLRRYTRPPERR